MKIYVIEKQIITCSECFEYDDYENEICKEAGAFDNFETAFNIIFSCIKQDVDEYLGGKDGAEISEPTVDENKHVKFSVEYYNGIDTIYVEYWVTELELNRTEA